MLEDQKQFIHDTVYISVLIILAVTVLSSCGGQSGKSEPVLTLQIQPIAGVYVQHDSRSNAFRMGNDLIERRISASPESPIISSTAFINKLSGRDYIKSLSEEFSFRANGINLSGITGDFRYVEHKMSGVGDMRTLEITLETRREEVGILRVILAYEIYSREPVIRKRIEIENLGGSPVTIDSIKVESLNLMPGEKRDLEIYNDAKTISPVVLNTYSGEGFFIGNEAPGVLKYADIYSNGDFISIGMRPYYQKYAPEIRLEPKERFTSPETFIMLFKTQPDKAQEALESFVAEYLAWSKAQDRSVWYESIDDSMTDSAAYSRVQFAMKSGADTFCLDGKWMDKLGDWIISGDRVRNLSQKAHDLGIKFGLSIVLAVADPDSQTATEYPQWLVKTKSGGDYDADGGKMMCLGSEYALYAVHEIDGLVRNLKLDYIKLTGPILPDSEIGGCFAEDHVHRSGAESWWYIYESFFAMCAYLHAQHPYLIIDVSPDSYDPSGKTDYALLKYADVEWPF